MAVVLAIKLGLAAVGGPYIQNDSGLYIRFADALLDPQQNWLLNAGWLEQTSPFLLLRTAGYPLLLAASKLLAGDAYGWPVIILQTIVTFGWTVLAYRIAAAVLPGVGWRLAFLALLTVSQSLLFDLVVMTDSLYASLLLYCCLIPLGACLGLWRLGGWGAVGLGVLWGYSIWVRDAGMYFVWLPLIPLASCRWTQGEGTGVVRRWWPVFGFLAAAVAMQGGYMAWNEARVGRPIMSIVGQHNWLRPIFDMNAKGYAHPFTDDHPISRLVRERNIPDPWPEHLELLDILHREEGQNPIQLADTVKAAFIHYVKANPVGYALIVADHMMLDRLAFNLTNPVYTLNLFFQYGPIIGHRVEPGIKQLSAAFRRDGDIGAGAVLVGLLAGRVMSLAAFAVFVVGVPWWTFRAWRRGAVIGPPQWTAVYGWVALFGFSFLYALVHFEDRHLLPVAPLGLLALLWALAELLRQSRMLRDSRLKGDAVR